ncbi:MAG: response regulator [Acetobacteraceae bacterium]
MKHRALAGRRVMIVEDELLIAMLIEDTLAEQACVIVGPFAGVNDALEAARAETLDLAVLDVNLRGEKVYPVAEVLAARGVPFVLLSGYGKDAIPHDHPQWRTCTKPFDPRDLVAILAEQIGPERNDSSS